MGQIGEVRQKMDVQNVTDQGSTDLEKCAQNLADRVDWAKGQSCGDERLVPAIAQCQVTGVVLMLGYMSRLSLLESGRKAEVVFYSRSRQSLWHKGATSGHRLELVHMALDCDGDALLLLCRPKGPVCHRGTATCFDGDSHTTTSTTIGSDGHHTAAGSGTPMPLAAFPFELFRRIGERAKGDDRGSYVLGLLRAGRQRILKKLGEEATETIIAGMASDPKAFALEAADLVFHLLVAGYELGVSPQDVVEALAGRQGQVRRDGSIPQ